MTALARRLGMAESLGLSLAVISPSVGMAFNISLAVAAVGAAAPLAFLLGAIVVGVVALSFVAFSRRIPHAGAAYAYVADAFGRRFGVAAGWTSLLAYLGFATSLAALTGGFVVAALGEAGVTMPAAASPVAIGAVLFSAWLARRDARLATRLMLALEFVSVLAILILAGVILAGVARAGTWSMTPFMPRSASALGYGLVFAFLSFAGFECAATLSEETRRPGIEAPRAMLASVIGAGCFFTVVSYAVVLGYGVDRVADLAGADAPLDPLARARLGPAYACALDATNAISALSGVLGSISAMARVIFALGRSGLSPSLAWIDARHGTPTRAVTTASVATVLPLLALPLGVGVGAYYGCWSTLGALALIAVYAAVTVAEAVEAARVRRAAWTMAGIAGAASLLWALACSVLPVPPPPANWWPYAVLAWIGVGFALPMLRRAESERPAEAGA